jgi:Ca2+-binding EF-hand superfamily protein
MRSLTVLCSLLFIAGSALSQTMVPKLDQDGRKGEMARLAKDKAVEKFNAADTDKDGKLSREEVEKAAPYMGENFEKYDKDTDGSLSWEEYVGHNRWSK